MTEQFYEIMAKPFIEKADRMKENLDKLEKEQRTQKSLLEIKKIQENFLKIQEHYIPKISRATDHRFTHPCLFYFLFLYREINAVFNEARTNPVQSGRPVLLRESDLKEMILTSEDFLTLAYIGDAALELGVFPSIWPQNPEEIPSNESLNTARNCLVENPPLAHFGESIGVFDPGLFPEHSADNDKTKGSIMEAVFGIIYLEGGLEAVEKSLQNLIKSSGKKKKEDGLKKQKKTAGVINLNGK